MFSFDSFHSQKDQDQVRIPEETELNNSKMTVNSTTSGSGDEHQTTTINSNSTSSPASPKQQANGNGKSIVHDEPTNDRNDAT